MGEREPESMGASSPCVLVCVTGCIAAYKACEVVRLLQKSGYRVKVLMSEHATKFVGPTTFRALTHEKVAIGLFDDPEDPIHHISLAQEADLVLVAPATANVLAKMAHGIADDLLSTTLLATRSPIVVAPAMNAGMWEAAATRENVATLVSRGVTVIEPDSGYLACGEVAAGRFPEPARVVDEALTVLESSTALSGKNVLVTAGGTQEPIDPVRFIGNRSTGKMGVALAEQARRMGASVTLVMGSVEVVPPYGVTVMPVQTAAQMHEAVMGRMNDADIVICAAAVADYTPAQPSDHKLKKAVEHLNAIQLKETADILADVSQSKGDRVVIGFAAETDNVEQYAQLKLERKGCDAIVANDVARADSGFGTDTNKAWWVDRQGIEELPLLSKTDLAREILSRCAAMLSRS